MNSSSDQRICSKSKCKRVLSHDDPKKTCQKCRDADRLSTAARRKRKREQEHEHEAPRPAPSPPTTHNIDEGSSQAADTESDDECILYENAQCLFAALRTLFKGSSNVQFNGSYLVPEDPVTSEKERVQMAALEIWRTTGYRFRVQHNYPLKTGHKIILWCCQDKNKKQKSRPSQKEGVKHCDTIGMKRFSCRSALTISCCHRVGNEDDERTLSIRIKHCEAHVPYYDVAMPLEATQIICDQLEWSSPSSLAPKIQALYPHITASQVHFAWTKMSEILWKKDLDQLTSAKMLLDEFDRDIEVFDVEMADGVEQLCWAMKKITQRLEGKVVEIGLDAMYNTNAKHLELYSVLGEFDNAGFPLSYCLLLTATAIEIGKRTTALR
ncbi:hypothetical protein DFH29DRAFT_815867 [Suillus ampliporus]|nr:hypothetical protein DFH29DRAFT_815867 [Suillus ampliporus]